MLHNQIPSTHIPSLTHLLSPSPTPNPPNASHFLPLNSSSTCVLRVLSKFGTGGWEYPLVHSHVRMLSSWRHLGKYWTGRGIVGWWESRGGLWVCCMRRSGCSWSGMGYSLMVSPLPHFYIDIPDLSRRRRLFAIHLWKLHFLCFLSLDAWMSIRAMLVRLPKPGST
jgi:hypothetical protein